MKKKILVAGAILAGITAVGAVIVAAVERMNAKRLEELLEDELDEYDEYEEEFGEDYCDENDDGVRITRDDVKDIQAAVGGEVTPAEKAMTMADAVEATDDSDISEDVVDDAVEESYEDAMEEAAADNE